MKLNIFSVKDRAAGAFGRPFFLPTTGLAIRGFTDEVNRRTHENGVQNDMHVHADDFELYELGEFDDEHGVISLHERPKLLLLAKQAKLPESV